MDFLGLNYYSVSKVLPAEVKNADGVTIQGLPIDNDDPSVPKTDLGWQIYPQGMHDLVANYWGRFHLPILITENGIADAADTKRARFLVDHVDQLLKARDEGAQVWGYTYWSLVDNFEWAKGFAPKFGLYHVDYATQTRTPKGSYRSFQGMLHNTR